ncbi:MULTISPECIES: type I-D CRISPR-associated protein Cas7/Csc2 [Rhodobacterales]|uniref:type I-D CRISPR-associated protein Cas7/Csc2 n=1 Tax=Rhodobacterales TaxID=204455 RepID=UPI0011080591|nr:MULTISPECIES: type I-D CRISPR-associated protein Cas7/Csc2 [Rhodobacterales]
MSDLSAFSSFLGNIDGLSEEAQGSKKTYVMPALKNLGTVTIPLVREVISPASFRNEQSEITDIDTAQGRRVRAVANKFKYGERRRGLQVLRYFGAGGAMPQNRTELLPGKTAGAVFDMNTVVFGDSTDAAGKVLPVKAAALYSDAVSLVPYEQVTDHTFHNRASEDGTLWDAEANRNSNNLFERHFLKPGTLLVQTITFTGRTAPREAIEHLLLCIGLAGAYGGQTSIYGINVRTHLAGIYGSPLERDISSPYVLLDGLPESLDGPSGPAAAVKAIADIFSAACPVSLGPEDAADLRDGLIRKLESGDAEMRSRYQRSQEKIAAYFDAWFDGIRG